MIDINAGHAHARAEELLRVADLHRRRRLVRRPGPSLVVRVYARLWWASRPRAGAWAPALLR